MAVLVNDPSLFTHSLGLYPVITLELCSDLAKKAQQSGQHWLWLIPTLHNAMQGFMVAALKGSNRVNILRKDAIRPYLSYLEEQTERPGGNDARLADFLDLYKRIKRSDMLVYGQSHKFRPLGEQDRSVKRLNELRNELIHFLPKALSLQTEGLSQLVLDCVAVTEFLAFESNNISWTDEALHGRTEQAIRDLRATLRF